MIDKRLRCPALVVIPIDNMKRCNRHTGRCIRHTGHSESHIWVESENRANGSPILIQWDLSEERHFEYQRVYNR